MNADPAKWATEAEVIAFYKLENVGHCESCHADAEAGERMAFEITLPDGRMAEVCCIVGVNVPFRTEEGGEGGT